MGGNVNKYINVLIESQTSVVEEIVFNPVGGRSAPRGGCLPSANKIHDKWLISNCRPLQVYTLTPNTSCLFCTPFAAILNKTFLSSFSFPNYKSPSLFVRCAEKQICFSFLFSTQLQIFSPRNIIKTNTPNVERMNYCDNTRLEITQN